ncbi:Protein of unknown function [Paenibacillus sp. 1_12]|uniref:hemoblobin-interacting domain-containing protein n=1 Tax=Paenibacillus sp. 1_12 TaxID=1566278 RepID=UPI0008ED29FD|nr:DUF1533 domain-containing protein [Paenibacillus sp. 1_12]SFL98219.1 Protein of unknown function [Paenibacillus sp. 1_12]
MISKGTTRSMNKVEGAGFLSGFTKMLLKRGSISLFLVFTIVMSSFTFNSSASAAPDATPGPINYVGSSSNNNGSEVFLNFNKQFTINNNSTDPTVTASTYLKSHMSIATDGVNYLPISNQIDVYPPGLGGSQIRLQANNSMKVILGTNTLIKIAKGTLTDADGNINEEVPLHITPPVIQRVAISDDYKKVTISFQENVVDNTYVNGSSTLISDNKIYLLQNGSNANQTSWTSKDEAFVESGKLVIKFDTPLSGAKNQIVIKGGALKDSYGNILSDNTITPLIQGAVIGDTSPLEVVNRYLTNSYQDIKLVFNKDVLNAKSDSASLLAGIKYYGGNLTQGDWKNLPPGTNLEISGNTVTIHFAAKLARPNIGYYYFEFASNSFKDTRGNIYSDYIYLYNYYINSSLNPENPNFSNDGRWLRLGFNVNIADLTVVNGVSHLKDQITISTDNGPLTWDAQDNVVIQENNLVIFFHNAIKSGSVKVEIAANAISDVGNNVQNQQIDRVIAYNYPNMTGFFLSDTASQFVFEDNAEWRSKVRDITIIDTRKNAVRQLNPSEYTLSAGMLTINNGVFQQGVNYYILVNAEGYSSKEFYGTTYVSTELFYMTAPVVTKDNGITAKVNILKRYNTSNGTQAIVFKLMNGKTPVSIVASNLSIGTGAYSANFNVADAATNPNYTVEVFVVNQFNNDPTNLGLNLASTKSQLEFDQAASINGDDEE